MPTLNIADLSLAIIWLFFSFRGYMRGLVKEVGSLAAIAMGFYCAGTYHKALATHLTGTIAGNYAGTAAYLIIFTVALIAVWFLALAVSGIVKVTMTQWADRLFGGAFGLAKGIILTAAVLFLIHLAAPAPDFLKGSILVPVLEKVSARLVNFIPPDINDKLRSLGKKNPLEAVKAVEDRKPPEKAAAPEKKAPEFPRPTEPEKKTAEQPKAEDKKPAEPSKTNPEKKKADAARPEAAKAAATGQSAQKNAADKAAATSKAAARPADDAEKRHE